MTNFERPYYHAYAWAYDLLQTEAVAPRVDFIQTVLEENGIAGGAKILDAGCGTGRYATELARRGFRVWGVDRSEELISIARNRDRTDGEGPEFVAADLLGASFATAFDAVLCRGVLNDIVDDAERRAIFRRFSEWLRPGGVLIFDVREWAKTLERKTAAPVELRTVAFPNGTLEFQSTTTADRDTHRLHVRERFVVERDGVRTSTGNDFVMRCWTRAEIASHLSLAGLEELATHATYGTLDSSWTDRLVIVARRELIP
jgi:2-polyprenyl-3-methyl-5-hydroxy-6-metoxy-1,4-benzoquinol methylase